MKTLDHNKAMPNALVVNTILEHELYLDDAIINGELVRHFNASEFCDIEDSCIREVDELIARMINQ